MRWRYEGFSVVALEMCWACSTHVCLASSPEVEGVTGKYWADNK